jgi:hypothetical protein
MTKSTGSRLLLSCVLCLSAHPDLAAAQAAHTERIKRVINESKTPPDTIVVVKLRDGRKVTGTVSEINEDHFVLNNVRAGAPLMVPYQDVIGVRRKGPSFFTKAVIAALIGGTVVLTVMAIVTTSIGH